MTQQKVILTADEAISALPDGEYVHSQMNPSGGMFLGCDYDHSDAVELLNNAEQIEIGGPMCRSMGHPLVVWKKDDNRGPIFLEANMDKLNSIEQEKLKSIA